MVYLIHLERPLSDRHSARHYIGFSNSPADLGRRIKAHHDGKGSRFTQVAVERNIPMCFTRLWPYGDRSLERQLKNRKEAPRLCPICNPETARNLANY